MDVKPTNGGNATPKPANPAAKASVAVQSCEAQKLRMICLAQRPAPGQPIEKASRPIKTIAFALLEDSDKRGLRFDQCVKTGNRSFHLGNELQVVSKLVLLVKEERVQTRPDREISFRSELVAKMSYIGARNETIHSRWPHFTGHLG
jgi:hypothetical protein